MSEQRNAPTRQCYWCWAYIKGASVCLKAASYIIGQQGFVKVPSHKRVLPINGQIGSPPLSQLFFCTAVLTIADSHIFTKYYNNSLDTSFNILQLFPFVIYAFLRYPCDTKTDVVHPWYLIITASWPKVVAASKSRILSRSNGNDVCQRNCRNLSSVIWRLPSSL